MPGETRQETTTYVIDSMRTTGDVGATRQDNTTYVMESLRTTTKQRRLWGLHCIVSTSSAPSWGGRPHGNRPHDLRCQLHIEADVNYYFMGMRHYTAMQVNPANGYQNNLSLINLNDF